MVRAIPEVGNPACVSLTLAPYDMTVPGQAVVNGTYTILNTAGAISGRCAAPRLGRLDCLAREGYN